MAIQAENMAIQKSLTEILDATPDEDVPLRDLVSQPSTRTVIPLEESARDSYRTDTGETVYLLKRRIPNAQGYTAAEQHFFQEGDDISFVNALLSGETQLPSPRRQYDSHHSEVRVLSHPLPYQSNHYPVSVSSRHSTRLFRAAGAALVTGMALFASCFSGLYEGKQDAVPVHETTRYDGPASGSSNVGTYK